MQEILALVGSFSLVFAVSYAGGRLAMSYAERCRVNELEPAENSKMRIRTDDALYRARFTQHEGVWGFYAPMQRDSYVPISIGAPLIAEVTTPKGLLVFQTRVISRMAEAGIILIEKPIRPQLINRRGAERLIENVPVDLNGHRAFLIDVSESGARLRTESEIGSEFVRVRLADGRERSARVIERLDEIVRVQFAPEIVLA